MGGPFGSFADGQDDAVPFLDNDPPHWAARALARLLLLLFGVALIGSAVVRVPEAVSGRFTLIPVSATDPVQAARPGRLQAELRVPESGLAELKPGLGVKLLYDAFPYQRYGVRAGTVRWVGPAGVAAGNGGAFRALVDLADTTVRVRGEPRPLMAGMGGEARVVVGRRSLMSYAFEPVRELRESFAGPPSR